MSVITPMSMGLFDHEARIRGAFRASFDLRITQRRRVDKTTGSRERAPDDRLRVPTN